MLGQEKVRVTKCDREVVNDLMILGKKLENKDGIKQVIEGKTMCAHDFYEGESNF